MGMRLLGPSKLVLSVSGISPSVMSAIAEGSKVGPNTAMRTTVDDEGRLVGWLWTERQILWWWWLSFVRDQ